MVSSSPLVSRNRKNFRVNFKTHSYVATDSRPRHCGHRIMDNNSSGTTQLPVEQGNITQDASIPLTSTTSIPSSSSSTANASWAKIYSLCIANFGINCAWALEFAITTPYFEKGLQAGKVISHAVWVVGPLSGLIVAPIVGSLSDRCRSRFGRRRPFILIGLITTMIGMAIFSNATQLAYLMTRSNDSTTHILSIVIAILAFCILDLAVNTTMWPVRALQGDLIPNHQQHSVQSASIVMFSLGDLAASMLLGLFPEPVSRIQTIFLVAALIYSTSVASLLLLGKEKPLDSPDDDGTDNESEPVVENLEDQPDEIRPQQGELEQDLRELRQLRQLQRLQELQRQVEEQSAEQLSFNIFEYLRSLPSWMWRIGFTHALGFFSIFCFLPNMSSWLGTTVLGGNPDARPGSDGAKLYEQGVSIYGSASLPRTFIQIVYSAIYPYLLNCVTPAQLMSFSFGVFGILLLCVSGTHTQLLGQAAVVSMALPIAAHFTLPVGLTVENSGASNRGRYLGALNCFAVVPQLIDTSYTGFVSRQFGEATVIRIGAVWAICTSVFALLYMRV